jgi:hypothetical protein
MQEEEQKRRAARPDDLVMLDQRAPEADVHDGGLVEGSDPSLDPPPDRKAGISSLFRQVSFHAGHLETLLEFNAGFDGAPKRNGGRNWG